MELNRANIALASRGFQVIFQTAFDAERPTYSRIAMETTSTGSEEQYPWLSSMPQIREWLGPRQVQNLKTSDFVIKNKTFEGTVSVKAESIEDDKIGVYAPVISQLGQSAATHPDLLCYGMLKNGFTQTCFDGQYFFDTDHPGFDANGNVTSVSNMQSGSSTPWFLICSNRAIKPIIYQKRRPYRFVRKDQLNDDNVFFDNELIYGTDGRSNAGYGLWQFAFGSKADLTAENYASARAAMGSFYNAAGQPIGLVPDLLVVPPSLEGAANTILKSQTQANGATNPWAGTAEVLKTGWLA